MRISTIIDKKMRIVTTIYRKMRIVTTIARQLLARMQDARGALDITAAGARNVSGREMHVWAHTEL